MLGASSNFPYSTEPVLEEEPGSRHSDNKHYAYNARTKQESTPFSQGFHKTNTTQPARLNQARNQQSKELQICYEQIQALKDQIQLQQKQKDCMQNMMKQLKKQLQAVSKEANKQFQENERNKHMMEKLKLDIKSMEMEKEQFSKERRMCYSKLQDIDQIRGEVSTQIKEKNTAIEENNHKIRKLERQNGEYKLKLDQIGSLLSQKDRENREYAAELKKNLEQYLSSTSMINKLQHQLTQTNQINRILKDKVHEAERQKEMLMEKLGYDVNSPGRYGQSVEDTERIGDSRRSCDSNSGASERSMLEIQSFMKEIQNLLDYKKADRLKKMKNIQQLRVGVQCLDNNL